MAARTDPVMVSQMGRRIEPLGPSLALAASFALFAAPAVVDLVRTSWRTEAGSLAPIVLALGGYTLWRDYRRSRQLSQSGRAAIWLPALILAALLLIFASAIAMTSLGAMALWLAGVAVIYALVGSQVVRRCAFPLLFLAMIVPLPYTLSMPMNAALRGFVAEQAVALASWLGIDAAIDAGVVIVGPYVLAIENACAGTNSTLTLVSLSVLYAYWLRTHSAARAWLAGLLAVPIALAANIGRVVALMAMVQWRGSAVLDTAIHPLAGLISFLLAAALLLGADRAFGAIAGRRA